MLIQRMCLYIVSNSYGLVTRAWQHAHAFGSVYMLVPGVMGG